MALPPQAPGQGGAPQGAAPQQAQPQQGGASAVVAQVNDGLMKLGQMLSQAGIKDALPQIQQIIQAFHSLIDSLSKPSQGGAPQGPGAPQAGPRPAAPESGGNPNARPI